MSRFSGVAIAGIGQTPLYKRGTAPRGQLGLVAEAIGNACADARLDVRDIDGAVSYGHDTNEGPKLAAMLGLPDLRWSSMVWGGGGGGIAGALAHAAAAVVTGQARCVAVYRAMAEADSGRLGLAVSEHHMNAHYRASGIVAPPQICAMRAQRLVSHDGVPQKTFLAVAKAAYYHAKQNPHAVAHTFEFDESVYNSSRWIAEPFRLFDCSRENDGAAALLVTAATDAVVAARPPVHVIAVVQSTPAGWGEMLENDDDYTSAGFSLAAKRLWSCTGLTPDDIDVVQVYENFTGSAVAALIDLGFCTHQTAGDVLVFENLIAPLGKLPINTAGGNLGEGFVHGIGLALEAVRQLRNESTNQVPDAHTSMLIGGPVAPFVSSAILANVEI